MLFILAIPSKAEMAERAKYAGMTKADYEEVKKLMYAVRTKISRKYGSSVCKRLSSTTI